MNIILACLPVQIVSDEKTEKFNDQHVISYTFKEKILIYYENKHAFILYLYFLYCLFVNIYLFIFFFCHCFIFVFPCCDLHLYNNEISIHSCPSDLVFFD